MTLKALILTWSGFQDQEVVYPYYRLLGAGIDTIIVADQRDTRNRVFGILGVNMPCHLLIEEFKTNSSEYLNGFDLLVLPGGVKALEKLRLESKIIEFIKLWNENGKLIASTCHGAQLLISAKAVKGRKISGYYSLQVDIENAGGIYSAEPYVIDENIVSSPHYDHMGVWMEVTIAKMQRNFIQTQTQFRETSKSPFPTEFAADALNLAIDFDGVLHDDDMGFFDGTCYGKPIPGSLESIKLLANRYKLIVLTAKAKSSRPLVNGYTGTQLVWEWLEKNGFGRYISEVTAEKPRAFAYIDDKAIAFRSWAEVLATLDSNGEQV